MGEALALQGGFDPYDSSFDPPTPTSIFALGSETLNEMFAGKITPAQTGPGASEIVCAVLGPVRREVNNRLRSEVRRG